MLKDIYVLSSCAYLYIHTYQPLKVKVDFNNISTNWFKWTYNLNNILKFF
jgi:hypothetical protein